MREVSHIEVSARGWVAIAEALSKESLQAMREEFARLVIEFPMGTDFVTDARVHAIRENALRESIKQFYRFIPEKLIYQVI